MPVSESTEIQTLKRMLEPEPPFLVFPSSTTIRMPTRVYELFKQLVERLAAGKSVTLTLGNELLTTQQAADILCMSRPTFVKLLESGAMPYHRVGNQRRVLLRDVMEYTPEWSAATPRPEREPEVSVVGPTLLQRKSEPW
jgi:excisionase family DNA binding protein